MLLFCGSIVAAVLGGRVGGIGVYGQRAHKARIHVVPERFLK